jgi:hypothetical protein
MPNIEIVGGNHPQKLKDVARNALNLTEEGLAKRCDIQHSSSTTLTNGETGSLAIPQLTVWDSNEERGMKIVDNLKSKRSKALNFAIALRKTEYYCHPIKDDDNQMELKEVADESKSSGKSKAPALT